MADINEDTNSDHNNKRHNKRKRQTAPTEASGVRNGPSIQAHLESQRAQFQGEGQQQQPTGSLVQPPNLNLQTLTPLLTGTTPNLAATAAYKTPMLTTLLQSMQTPFQNPQLLQSQPSMRQCTTLSPLAHLVSQRYVPKPNSSRAKDPPGHSASDGEYGEAGEERKKGEKSSDSPCSSEDECSGKSGSATKGKTGRSSKEDDTAQGGGNDTAARTRADATNCSPTERNNTRLDALRSGTLEASIQVPPSGLTWNDCYLQLANFKQAHGHANPTNGHLAGWLACQRVLFRQGIHPSPVQVELLRTIGAYGFDEAKGRGGGGLPPATVNVLGHPPQLRQYSISPRMPPAVPSHLPPSLKNVAPANATSPASGPRPTPARSARKLPISGASTNASTTMPPLRYDTKTTSSTTTGTTGRERNRGHGTWDDRFQQLLAYKERNGNPNPPQTKGSPTADYKLAIWLNSQRQKFRKGTLDDDKYRKLTNLGCEGFNEETRNSSCANYSGNKNKHSGSSSADEHPPKKRKKRSWNDSYEDLKAFKRRVGHANPQYGSGTPDSCQHLAQWLSNQRSDFRLAKKISMDQVQLLRDLGCKGFEGTRGFGLEVPGGATATAAVNNNNKNKQKSATSPEPVLEDYEDGRPTRGGPVEHYC